MTCVHHRPLVSRIRVNVPHVFKQCKAPELKGLSHRVVMLFHGIFPYLCLITSAHGNFRTWVKFPLMLAEIANGESHE